MSYFPCDIPFMSEDEKKKNGIKTAKEIETQKTQLSEGDTTFDCVSIQQVIERIKWWFEILEQNPDILIDAIKTLPSTQPESCDGCQWEYAFGYGECHHCKRNFNDMYERGEQDE